MVNQSLLFDTFNVYYEKAEDAKANGDNANASRFYLLSSQSMLKLAQASEGELRLARLARAERLINKANALSETKSPSKKEGQESGSVQSSDDEEVKFVAADKPDINFNDVAGLTEVKEAVFTRIINPRRHPDVYRAFRKKTGGGVLMYGPPGTGKTMIAKAIAHEVGALFYPIRCSDIVSKWFGEAEKNVKNLFETARQQESAIIFFDEFDSLGAKRSGHSTVMSRLVPELLSQINGFLESENMLMVLAATNRPWDIDSAFLRPERFSELLYIPLPDHPARKHIIQKMYKDVPIESNIDFDTLAKDMEGFNGADVVEFCDRSKDYAIKRCIENGGRIDDQVVTKSDIKKCAENFTKSVQQQDLISLEKFKRQYHQGVDIDEA